MGQTFTGSEMLGDIAAGLPSAVHLFKDYKIDFCCGGHRTLSSALQEQQIDERAFLEQLNHMLQQVQGNRDRNIDWREVPAGDLIDHIVQTHHAYLNKELPLLSELIIKILRVHGPAHPELTRLHKLFHQLKMELEQHLITEEEIVFPLIRKAEQTKSQTDRSKAADTILELEAEHGAAGNLLKEIREITQDYRLPDGVCQTYALTFQKLEELESDLFEHIHLENNVLFPRVGCRC